MLADILSLLKDQLEATGLFGDIYPIAEIKRTIQDGKPKTFPAVIESEGNYRPLEYDTTGGMTYFRKNGQVYLSELKQDQAKRQIQTSCGNNNTVY